MPSTPGFHLFYMLFIARQQLQFSKWLRSQKGIITALRDGVKYFFIRGIKAPPASVRPSGVKIRTMQLSNRILLSHTDHPVFH
jgi:hypothetical protein